MLIIVLAVLGVALVALPASLLRYFLPDMVRADDFSGSLWHGSAGKISVNSRTAGALEWRIHPFSLLGLRLSADVHWVMVGFVADAAVIVDRHGLAAHDIHGGGPIDDLGVLGLATSWHGLSRLDFSGLELKFDESGVTLRSAVGEFGVEGLASPQIAGGADLGGYQLHVASGAILPNGDATAELHDTGGPLQVQAVIHFSAKERTGLLSGTIKERAGATAALREQVKQLEQMHARDAAGRIPVELEFTL
jgi:hypothetical protein